MALGHPVTADGRCRAGQDLRVAALNYRPHIFEDHVAAGTLCQAVTDFLANHLKVIGRQADRFQIGYVDDFDRHLLLVEEQARFVGAVGGRVRLVLVLYMAMLK